WIARGKRKVPDAKGGILQANWRFARGPTIIRLPLTRTEIRNEAFRTQAGPRLPEEEPERHLHRLPQRDGVPLRWPPDRRNPGAVERRAELGSESRLRRAREESGQRGPPHRPHLPQRQPLARRRPRARGSGL